MQRGACAATKEITMTSSSPLAWRPAEARHPVHEAVRQLAARSLHSASAAMARLAGRLTAPVVTPAVVPMPADPHLEFHADAGAPEGALYLDGHLVGWVQGVTRL
jgi:hypothetical protein